MKVGLFVYSSFWN